MENGEICIEPAEAMFDRQRKSAQDRRKGALVIIVSFVVGIVIGLAGDRQIGHRTPALPLADYAAYGSVLGSAAAHNPCSSFSDYAGPSQPHSPAVETALSGIAAAFYAEATRLPRGSTFARGLLDPHQVLTEGIAVNGVKASRRVVETGGVLERPLVFEPHGLAGQEPGIAHLGLGCQCPPPNVSVCFEQVLAVARLMLGCGCCGAPGPPCPAEDVVVVSPGSLCPQLPLTPEQAQAAATAADVNTVLELSRTTDAGLARIAADVWPHHVQHTDASSFAEAEAETVAAAVAEAAFELTGNERLRGIHAYCGWQPDNLPSGPDRLPSYGTLDDLVVAVRAAKARDDLASSGGAVPRWPVGPFDVTVMYMEAEHAVYVPMYYAGLTPELPAYRVGALAHSIATAVAHVADVRGCGGQPAESVEEAAARILAAAGSPPKSLLAGDARPLVPVDGPVIGPEQLYYIGAAAGPAGRIGHVPDAAFAKAFDCPVALC